MIIRSICLEGFRNYRHLETDFSPEVNIIYGENAQGKTNLLEAAAYLSTTRSHRARFDRELIAFDAQSAWSRLWWRPEGGTLLWRPGCVGVAGGSSRPMG